MRRAKDLLLFEKELDVNESASPAPEATFSITVIAADGRGSAAWSNSNQKPRFSWLVMWLERYRKASSVDRHVVNGTAARTTEVAVEMFGSAHSVAISTNGQRIQAAGVSL